MKFITECLRRGSSVSDPDQSIKDILAYLGSTVLCDRVYIFEFEENMVHNTYEWCRDGVTSQKEILQNVSTNDIESWMREFRLNKDVIIRNLEEIRLKTPTLYAILKPQNIVSLSVVPIYECGNMVGFFGVDNPDPDRLTLITPLLKVIGYYLVLLLKQRDLKRNLEVLKIRDDLTGAFNRAALYSERENLEQSSSIGVIYCDITGLKENNGLKGTEEGDRLLKKCYKIIREHLDISSIYRVNGDEFAVIYKDIPEITFMENVKKLENHIQKENHLIAVGYAWSDERPFNLDEIMLRADRIMCEKIYKNYVQTGKEFLAERKAAELGAGSEIITETEFYQFLKQYYYDPEQVFRSFTQQNTSSYFYFGDLQKDIFYISDNMRDEFGFQGNIVPHFLRAWEYRIVSEKFREIYRADHETLLREKHTVHDLRYQVRDINGKVMWIRCYGILKWNEDKTKPLFFSGRITHQDNEFVIDPITNFPRSSVMIRRLQDMKENGTQVRAIGFSFNFIADINNTKGRMYSDNLVHIIAEELMSCLSNKMSFYRLEGMKCIGVFEQECKDHKDDIVKQMRCIISKWYRKKGISVQNTCSFAYMEYSDPLVEPADFIEQMIDMIRVSKHDGNSSYIEYEEDSIEKAKQMSCMSFALSRDVLHGMKNFRVMIQPVVMGENGEIRGGELLLRWKYEGKDVPPAVFIPMMEKEKIIHVAGRWVFEKAVCTQLRISSYMRDFYVAFNVSMDQLADLHFTDYMEEILEKYKIDGTHLVAEMTENCMDEHPEKMTEFVSLCNKLGIRIALDDFGNGYSSLRRLLKYPSSIIKLDRSIMREMMKSEDKKRFISSIVYACHCFGKQVCMEGVETSEQNAMIKESGCDMIQGYYYYKPLEINDMYSILAAM